MPRPRCPACKIILDGGRYAAALRLLARSVGDRDPLHAAAHFAADMADATVAAIMNGVRSGIITGDDLDRAHAWSELWCHRAALIEAAAQSAARSGEEEHPQTLPVGTLLKWANEDRMFATELAGGEYAGAYTVNGTEGISKKPV